MTTPQYVTLPAATLQDYIARIFQAAGCTQEEAERTTRHLLSANLTGHDSHGIIRVPRYVQWLQEGKVPAEKSAQPLAPRPFKAVVLGADMKRSASGFEGTGGGYHATKLFLQRPGIEAELYFNFSLAEKSGGFSEKDPEYANDIVEFIASELRDGPRPKRTAQVGST